MNSDDGERWNIVDSTYSRDTEWTSQKHNRMFILWNVQSSSAIFELKEFTSYLMKHIGQLN